MTAFVILADGADEAAASRLAAMGHAVRSAGDMTRAQLAAARKVIVVWSRAARGTPALRTAARRAKACGKLVCVRLDAARPPVDLGGARAVRLPAGRGAAAAWTKLLRTPARHRHAVTSPVQATLSTRRAVKRPRSASNAAATIPTRGKTQGARLLAALTALALIAIAAGAEAYARDPDFAARLNALATQAQSQAGEIASTLTR